MTWFLRVMVAVSIGTAGPAVVPERRGTGAADISGYRVQDLAFASAPDAPDRVVEMSFDLDSAAGTARVTFGERRGWFECSASSTTHWVCPLPHVPIAEIERARVVAVADPSAR